MYYVKVNNKKMQEEAEKNRIYIDIKGLFRLSWEVIPIFYSSERHLWPFR